MPANPTNEIMEEKLDISRKLQEHDREIARQNATLVAMEKSVASLADTVKQSIDKTDDNFERILRRIDKVNTESRPDFKWIIGGIGASISLAVAIFTVVLDLTIAPVRQELDSQSHDIKEHRELTIQAFRKQVGINASNQERTTNTKDRLESVINTFVGWNNSQKKDIELNTAKLSTSNERISANEQNIKHNETSIRRVDQFGSSKWIGDKPK